MHIHTDWTLIDFEDQMSENTFLSALIVVLKLLHVIAWVEKIRKAYKMAVNDNKFPMMLISLLLLQRLTRLLSSELRQKLVTSRGTVPGSFPFLCIDHEQLN